MADQKSIYTCAYDSVIESITESFASDEWYKSRGVQVVQKKPGETGYVTESSLAQASGISLEIEAGELAPFGRDALKFNLNIWVYERPAVNRERPNHTTAMEAAVRAVDKIAGDQWQWRGTPEPKLAPDGATLIANSRFEAIVKIEIKEA